MVRPLSVDLRERLVLAVEREGIAARAAAVRFGVSVSSAIVWVRRYRTTGSVAPSKIGGYKPNILSGVHGDWLVERARGLSFKKKRASRRTASPEDRQATRAVEEVSGTA